LGKEDFRLYACAARVELAIPGALTLKDRRAVVRSILERLKSRFNVSAADLDGGERGASRAVLGISAVSNSREHAGETVRKVVEFIAGDGRAELGNVEISEI
jgi:uncharacterized protein YlxP (DUF503 family)